jgi:hypothetical protein
MQQEEPWIHVPSKTNRRSRKPAVSLQATNAPARDLTFEKLTAEFKSKLKTWQQSDCRKTALQVLKRIQPEEGWQVRKAICIGSGSLSRENMECRRRSFWQFVVFYDLVGALGSSGMTLYAQEPAFTELDREFLEDLGVRTLDVKPGDFGLGAAKGHLGPGTFLFEPFIDMNAAMLSELLQASVGLYVGSSIRGILGRQGVSEVKNLAAQFHERHEMMKFPTFEVDPNVLDGIGIYWEEERDEDEDGV